MGHAGTLARPVLGDVGRCDDDIVACVVWMGGHAQVKCAPAQWRGDARVVSWIKRAIRTVSAREPLAYLTRRDLELLGG